MSKKKKFILDACCGGRMMWFNKNHPNTIYQDIRDGVYDLSGWGKFKVKPDIIQDFRKMESFKDGSFKLVVFDPPHSFFSESSVMFKRYGSLIPETWQSDLKRGFNECWRVLDNYGVLIFKWNDTAIQFDYVIKVIGKKPLFYNKINSLGRKNTTYWACFMKIPKGDLN